MLSIVSKNQISLIPHQLFQISFLKESDTANDEEGEGETQAYMGDLDKPENDSDVTLSDNEQGKSPMGEEQIAKEQIAKEHITKDQIAKDDENLGLYFFIFYEL